MRRHAAWLLLVPLLAPLPAAAEEAPSTAAVHAAVERGARWLAAQVEDGYPAERWTDTAEIVVLTLAHAGVDRNGEVFQEGLEALLTCPLRYTYRVSVLAMALGHVNPYLYRDRLAQCAQWLVDTQLEGGEWGYPGSVRGRRIEVEAIPPVAEEEVVEGEGGGEGSGREPIAIERRTDPAAFAGAKGDFSNTQFAVLGLKACRDARIEVPEATWQAALDYMLRHQHEDGGWGYVVAGQPDESSYASLTCAGAVGAAICLHALGTRRPRSHAAVRKALRWLDRHWDASRNDGIDRSAVIGPSTWQYYHLYSVERVGSILDVKEIGRSAWYAAGARWLLEHQRADGSWEDPRYYEGGPKREYLKVADTCFALLFLTRATPPLTRGD